MLYVIGIMVGALAAAAAWTARGFAARIHAAERAVGAGAAAQGGRSPADRAERPALPARLVAFLERAGTGASPPPTRWTITQQGTMQLRPDGPWLPFSARQTFATRAPEFAWAARFRAFRVLDALVAGGGRLEARLFGVIPVVRAHDPATTRAQLARYLAEVPWVPWAISANRSVTWREDGDSIVATARVGDATAEITFGFDLHGDIIEARGLRERTTPDGPVPTPWLGTFHDYRTISGVRIPTRAEVAWQIDDHPAPYFRTQLLP